MTWQIMTILTRTLQNASRNWIIYTALLVVLAGLVVFSPAEATLGNVVKIVYLHAATERIAAYAYLIAGVLGTAYIVVSLRARSAKQSFKVDSEIASSHKPLLATLAPHVSAGGTLAWTRAFAETAILFWLAQFIISAPAQVLAWGAFTLNEPRVASAMWILAMTALVYVVARWIAEPMWMAFAAIANGAIFLIVLQGAVNILHPGSAILGSDSVTIKFFYAGIVIACGVIALQLARDLATRYTRT
jgi:hypothetical protein